MKPVQILARPFVVFVERFYPDPFVFSIILTLVAFILALALTPAGFRETLLAWGNGLSSLLAFTAQICLMLLSAHVVSHTDFMQRVLIRCGRLPRTEFQAYMYAALTTGLFSLIAWSLGLVAGAIMAREIAVQGRNRGLVIHYPLLVASAYVGHIIWHMGYSGSATLAVATPGHQLESQIGLIPVTETIFRLSNMGLALLTLTVIAIVCPLMRPEQSDAVQIDLSVFKDHSVEESSFPSTSVNINTPPTFALQLDNLRPLSIFCGLVFAAFLIIWFIDEGLNLNLNIVIWTFVCLGLLLARSPIHYMELTRRASTTVGMILIQYPLYAGILGIMQGTGLGSVFSRLFIHISTPETLPFWAFLSGGLLNIFVPSGGGQWAIQGPIFIESAKTMGVDPALIVLGVAYGDQWTNSIQPFWTIPVLAIAGLQMRQIMGYTFIICLVTSLIFGGGLLLMS